jgi:hypothetical protein
MEEKFPGFALETCWSGALNFPYDFTIPASGAALCPIRCDDIRRPRRFEVLLQVHAVGSQIYVCQVAADGKSGWTLKAPDAELRDQHGEVLGRHYAGPTWKHKDGSEVTGKAAARSDAPDAGSIPWLLVTATGHSGQGVFSAVTSIQRIHTKGGVAPSVAGCTQGAEVKSAYEADYYLYRAAR